MLMKYVNIIAYKKEQILKIVRMIFFENKKLITNQLQSNINYNKMQLKGKYNKQKIVKFW